MFKLYQIKGNSRKEVQPENGIYTVYELWEYEFEYYGTITGKLSNVVFIEDTAIDFRYYRVTLNSIISYRNRFFEDYFGFATLSINGESFNFNIKIEKFKLSEIEDILMFLWQSENKIFDLFISKSSLKSSVNKDGSELGITSKFLVFCEFFHSIYKKLLPQFHSRPQTVLRSKYAIVNYTPEIVSSHSVDWLLTNLESVKIDNKIQYYPDSIIINNNYGIIEKIETEFKQQSYAVYENEIILGSFLNILSKLSALKKEIMSNVNIERFSDSEFADFRDLKKLPFIKLFEDSNSIEKKIRKLYFSYKTIFYNTLPRNEKPKLTTVFSNRVHYMTAFKLIKDSREHKFNLEGELQLLNIKKLSQLYEAYNLYQILNNISSNLIIDCFDILATTNRDDKIVNKITYQNSDICITVLYEPKYYSKARELELLRIDTTIGSYYNPDYVIEIKSVSSCKYYILDSKYTKLYNLKGLYLHDCIYKYVLNTAIKSFPNAKIESLVLLYPGENEESYAGNDFYKPQIKMIGSKPKFEHFLNDFIYELLKTELNSKTLIKEITD